MIEVINQINEYKASMGIELKKKKINKNIQRVEVERHLESEVKE